MNCKEIVRDIMASQDKGIAEIASQMGITPAALWDRLKTQKKINGNEVKTLNITVAKLNDILRVLGYEIVIAPRKAGRKIQGAYIVDDTEGIKMSEVK